MNPTKKTLKKSYPLHLLMMERKIHLPIVKKTQMMTALGPPWLMDGGIRLATLEPTIIYSKVWMATKSTTPIAIFGQMDNGG